MNKFFSIHCGNKKLYTSLRSNPMIKCRCMDLHEVAYLFSSFLWTLCQVFLSDITQGSFSFAPLGDGENSWITNKCQGLPLPPLNGPYNTRPYYTSPYYTSPYSTCLTILNLPYSLSSFVGPLLHA